MKNPLLSPKYDYRLLRGGTAKDGSDKSSVSGRDHEDPVEWGDPWLGYVVFGFRFFRTKEQK